MLIDTSGFMCLYTRTEPYHHRAIMIYNGAMIKLTHNYILAEFIPLLSARGIPRSKSLEYLRAIHHSHEVKCVWVTRDIHNEATDLLHDRLDKHWSLCDAVSFVLMKRYHIIEALTTDRHFEQAGYLRLLV